MSLNGRSAAPAMDADTFRRLGHAVVERVARTLEDIPAGLVTRAATPDEVRAALDAEAPLPLGGTDPARLLDEVGELLAAHSLFNAHPRFFGYITAPPTPIGVLGDFLAAAVNANVGAWTLAPMATEIEAQTIRWIAELVGYPEDTGGLLVSGGNMANMVGFWAARAAADGSVRTVGVRGGLCVYASAETHTWVQKAADLAGLGTDAVRWIATDAALRLDMDALRRAVREDQAAGRTPMLVVGTAGSVSTGAVDPLAAIGAFCRETGIWFHVDGAYGAFAAAAPSAPEDLRALTAADSVALDPHKWLYAPLEVGCVLVRDRERLRAAFSYHPPYYHFGAEALNFVDYGPQNSRGFRALKVWLALRHAGRDGYVAALEEDMRLSRRLHERVTGHPALEALTQSLSINTFRYVPPDLRASVGAAETERYLDTLNEALLERVQRSGEAFVSNAVLAGRYALRACIVNFHTGTADVDALPTIVARLGAETDGRLRCAEPAQPG